MGRVTGAVIKSSGWRCVSPVVSCVSNFIDVCNGKAAHDHSTPNSALRLSADGECGNMTVRNLVLLGSCYATAS